MARCAALANQRKIVENILSEASDEQLHQRVHDHLRDIKIQQQNHGVFTILSDHRRRNVDWKDHPVDR
jgi:hypothetical protein